MKEQHGFAVIDVETMKVYATAETFETAVKLSKMTALSLPDVKEVLIYKLVGRMNNKNRDDE